MTATGTTLRSLDEAREAVAGLFTQAGASPANAASVAWALVMAEADGLKGHGLSRVPTYLAMLKATTGVEPVHITGKPNAGMILHKIEALGLDPDKCAMVGDRLYTDIAMATRAGCVGVLVLSGEATRKDVAALSETAEQQPRLIVESVDELLR